MYVPGFGSVSNNFYREPTLFTSKYDFQRDIGTAAPSFAAAQYYDEGKWDKDAIPDGGVSGFDWTLLSELKGAETMGIDKWNWSPDDDSLVSIHFNSPTPSEPGEEVITTAYIDHFCKTHCDVIKEGRERKEGDQWLKRDDTNLTLTVDNTITTAPASGYYECNPVSNEWYVDDESGSDTKVPPKTATGDPETIVTKRNVIGESESPSYYELTSTRCKMFEAGYPDPGYRYAKLLLSMGIPVYYEQMNSVGGDLTKVENPTEEQIADMKETYGLNTGKIWEENPEYQPDSTEFNRYILSTNITQQGTYYIGTPIQVDAMYEGINARFNEIPNMSKEDQSELEAPATGLEIDNMGDYTIKFFTTGGYPVFEYMNNGLAETMMEACTRRSDAIALIDHTNNPDRPIVASNTKSVSYKARNWTLGTIAGSYAAMFTPWYECSSPIVLEDYKSSDDDSNAAHYLAMPASLAYLTTLARQIRDYNPWLAVSGVRRGQVPYLSKLHINRNLTNNIADSYQQVPQDGYTNGKGALRSINPITNIRNYGCCIWGNRTLRSNSEGTKATSFLSTRNQISDIKKCIYETSQKLLFEQNSDVLWINWKSYVTPLLDSMISNNIIRDYTITRYNIDPESGERVPAYKILAAIRIVPINAVEQFELTINIENDTTDVVSVDVSER